MRFTHETKKTQSYEKGQIGCENPAIACTPSYAPCCLTPLIFKLSEKQFTYPPN